MEIKKIDLNDTGKTATSSPNISFVEESSKNPIMANKRILPTIIIFIAVIAAGMLTGSFLKSKVSSGTGSATSASGVKTEIPQSGVKVGDTYGSADEKIFRDKVLGVVDKGGVNGEGTHKLVRPGGSTQTVCISSTTIDLDQLVGHQVTLWGETFKGQKCGWLMDVGRAKIENLNVPLPN